MALGLLKSALDWSSRFRRTHGRDQHTDRQPGRPRNVGIGAFADAAPHIWNTLPTDVVAANPLVVHLPTTVETFFYSSNRILTSSTDIIQLVVLAVVAPLKKR